MTSRRTFLVSGLAAGAGLIGAPASAQRGRSRYVGGDDRPVLIPGNPDHVDCGHGLIIPLSGDALGVLWEGDDRFVTFGRAVSQYGDANAMGRAETTARANMTLLMLTLAFAPERLERFAICGWRTRNRNRQLLVQGTVTLPGRPFRPTVDEVGGHTALVMEGPNEPNSISHAVCVYVVLKSEGGVPYVRQNAQLVCPHQFAAPPPHQRTEAAMAVSRQMCPA